MDYYKKYLKYKQKYIQQKLLYGGEIIHDYKNINYTDCTIVDDKTANRKKIHCESVEFENGNNKKKIENVNWNSELINKYDINSQYNDEDDIMLNYINIDEDGVRGENKKNYSYKLIKTLSIKLYYYNYDNIADVSTDKNIYKKEKELCKLIVDNAKIFETEYVDLPETKQIISEITNLLATFIGKEIKLPDHKIIFDSIVNNFTDILKTYEYYEYSNTGLDIYIFNDGICSGYIIMGRNAEDETIYEYVKNIYSVYTIISMSLFFTSDFIKNMITQIIPRMLLRFIINRLKLKIICANVDDNIPKLLPECLIDEYRKKDLLDTHHNYIISKNYDLLSNIKYLENGRWCVLQYNAPDYIKFIKFNNTPYDSEVKITVDYAKKEEKFDFYREEYNFYSPIKNKKEILYFDFNNLKIFKDNQWEIVPYHIAWAYVNFISRSDKQRTKIKYSSNKGVDEHIYIDVYGIINNIQFTLEETSYKSIKYTTDNKAPCLICDNEVVRKINLMVFEYHTSDNYYTGDVSKPKILIIGISLDNNSLHQLLNIDYIVKKSINNTIKRIDMDGATTVPVIKMNISNQKFPKFIYELKKDDSCVITCYKKKELSIDIIYENVLLIAVLHNLLLKKLLPCYLQIIDNFSSSKTAADRACEKINKLGFLIPNIYLIDGHVK